MIYKPVFKIITETEPEVQIKQLCTLPRGALSKSFSEKLRKIHRKTPVPESLF